MKFRVKTGNDFEISGDSETSKTGFFQNWKCLLVFLAFICVFSSGIWGAWTGDYRLFDKYLNTTAQIFDAVEIAIVHDEDRSEESAKGQVKSTIHEWIRRI